MFTATAVLVVASTEVDKSGASYYGEQTLHYLAASGESAVVQLRECGPGWDWLGRAGLGWDWLGWAGLGLAGPGWDWPG